MADTVAIMPLEETYHPAILKQKQSITSINTGFRKAEPDDRDIRFTAKFQNQIGSMDEVVVDHSNPQTPLMTAPGERFPDYFTLEGFTGPVLDQGQTEQCVCYSGMALREQEELVVHKQNFHDNWCTDWYLNTKKIDPVDTPGTTIRLAAQVAQKTGVYMEAADGSEGGYYRIQSYTALATIEEILSALFDLKTVVWFGMTVDNGIFTPQISTKGAVLPPPNGNPIGGHAMTFEGFWLSMGWLRVKQSWGTSYGQGGYVWMPVSWLTEYPGLDIWITKDSVEDHA